MNSENQLTEKLEQFEKAGFDETIARVKKRIEINEKPRSLELGILLALTVAAEIREGKELGKESGELVASWNEKYDSTLIEEAIAHSREFLLHSSNLVDKIKKELFAAEENSQKAETN